jgi:galactokinase
LESEKNILTDIEYRRAKHVVGECERVYAAVDLLACGELAKFGQLWWDSHESSRVNFENSTPALDKIVEISHTLPGALGARLSGGGFGGSCCLLVNPAAADRISAAITKEYEAKFGDKPTCSLIMPSDGAHLV